MDDKVYADLLLEADKKNKIRLKSITGKSAGAWMLARPDVQPLRMNDDEYSLACRFRLGLPMKEDMPKHCQCGAPMEEDKYHWHSCRDNRGRSVRHRHDMIVNTGYDVFRKLGMHVVKEPYDIQKSSNRRPDLELVTHGTMTDVSITHPTAKSVLDKITHTQSAAQIRSRTDLIKKFNLICN